MGTRERRRGWKRASGEHLLCARLLADVTSFTLHSASFYICGSKAQGGEVTCSQSHSSIYINRILGFYPGFSGSKALVLSSKSCLKWLWSEETGWRKVVKIRAENVKAKAWISVPRGGYLQARSGLGAILSKPMWMAQTANLEVPTHRDEITLGGSS